MSSPRSWIASFLLLFLAPAAHAVPFSPLQLDASWEQTNDGEPAGGQFAFYAGGAWWDTDEVRGTFAGGGAELTVAEPSVTERYNGSLGAGTRFGTGIREGKKNPGGVPDAYVYTRFTPFVAFGDGETGGSRTRPSGGLRIGIGATVPAWSLLLAKGGEKADCNGGSGTPCDVLLLAYVAAMLVNHGEILFEVHGTAMDRLDTRIGFRIGTGF